jgi:glucose-6-phosphate isomerase
VRELRRNSVEFDLTGTAGFPLSFDSETLALATVGDLVFRRVTRTAAYLKDVLLSPDSVAPETELYYVDTLTDAPAPQKQVLDRYGLTYSFVVIPPRRIGQEFVKTHGHYHPLMPGGQVAFPEVYTQIHGTLNLILQHVCPSDPNRVTDCALFEMTPGFVLTVPPSYAHVLVNTTNEPALMAGLYAPSFKPDYSPIQKKGGIAYFLILGEHGEVAIESNSSYSEYPSLRRPDELTGSLFEPPEVGRPLWSSFFSNPEKYAFLSQPQAANTRFAEHWQGNG